MQRPSNFIPHQSLVSLISGLQGLFKDTNAHRVHGLVKAFNALNVVLGYLARTDALRLDRSSDVDCRRKG